MPCNCLANCICKLIGQALAYFATNAFCPRGSGSRHFHKCCATFHSMQMVLLRKIKPSKPKAHLRSAKDSFSCDKLGKFTQAPWLRLVFCFPVGIYFIIGCPFNLYNTLIITFQFPKETLITNCLKISPKIHLISPLISPL